MLTNVDWGPLNVMAELRVRMLLVLTPVDVCQVTQGTGLLNVKVSVITQVNFRCCTGLMARRQNK